MPRQPRIEYEPMTQLAVRIPARLHRELRVQCERQRETIGEFVKRALEMAVKRSVGLRE